MMKNPDGKSELNLAVLRRRSFLKRTGAATLGTAVFANFHPTVWATVGSTPHCPKHGDSCTWVTSISIDFTTATPHTDVPEQDYDGEAQQRSGRIFSGLMTVNTFTCDGTTGGGGTSSSISIAVQTGGYTVGDPIPAAPENDTAIPATSAEAPRTVGACQTGGNILGYNVTMDENQREFMEIHDAKLPEGGSNGCVVMSAGDWATFKDLMNTGNCEKEGALKCVHSPPQNIPITITYNIPCDCQGGPPQNNAPPNP